MNAPGFSLSLSVLNVLCGVQSLTANGRDGANQLTVVVKHLAGARCSAMLVRGFVS
jgi:hypothetical protein